MSAASKREQGRFSTRGAEMLDSVEAETAAIVADLLRPTSLPQTTQATLAKNAGKQVAERLRVQWGGQHVYISFDRTRRNNAIYEAFTGDNHHELAARFGLGVNTIYSIIKEEMERRRMKQLTLLGEE